MRPVSEHGSSSRKRKQLDAGDDEGAGDAQPSKFPGGGRKGVSSGLSTVVIRGSRSGSDGGEKSKWWQELGGGSGKSKGSMRL